MTLNINSNSNLINEFITLVVNKLIQENSAVEVNFASGDELEKELNEIPDYIDKVQYIVFIYSKEVEIIIIY